MSTHLSEYYDGPDDDGDDDQDDVYEDAEEWSEGQCDNCTGKAPADGEEITLSRSFPNAPITPVCACAIGQGASPENCVCGQQ